jgi:hypothetical protein
VREGAGAETTPPTTPPSTARPEGVARIAATFSIRSTRAQSAQAGGFGRGAGVAEGGRWTTGAGAWRGTLAQAESKRSSRAGKAARAADRRDGWLGMGRIVARQRRRAPTAG